MKKSPDKKINLSIIILNYNAKDFLEKCLLSVFVEKERIQKEFSVEVIVVDNKSTDDSVEMIRKKFSGVILVVSEKNLGFSGGNNLGIKVAGGNYILFLNPDTELKPGGLSKTLKFMEINKDVGALTIKTILALSGKMDPDCHRGFPTPWASISYFLGLESVFPTSKIFGQYHKLYLNLNSNHEIDSGAGAFMMIRSGIIKKVGTWDESYFFYGEDLDYFYRIKTAGYKVMFYAEPLVYHFKGASSGLRKETKEISTASKETRRRVAKESVKAMEIFYKKFYKDIYPEWLTFLVLTAIKIKGFMRVLKHSF